ncbi:hypothetical protein QWZ13_18155 [Reinekea marina]|uniref:hypothetical protein n=1 Tax=Reinekea marina TaxID=1310421 RepID=UPI0025B611CF|nr:hypothetical protein [Reinekea marina]MDN3650803.1 hypothetical protein [Reinekea marina]MDN3650813.1 hypothetical protein [Reinekea marina]MDN3650833.1 hypothetical protein [Reinekea marina]MDN3650834.1 hypothetical protein [Reinekea marina]
MNINLTFLGQFLLIFWFIPLLSIIFSKKVSGKEKLAWLLAMIFVSWFAWVFYMLLAPLKPKQIELQS